MPADSEFVRSFDAYKGHCTRNTTALEVLTADIDNLADDELTLAHAQQLEVALKQAADAISKLDAQLTVVRSKESTDNFLKCDGDYGKRCDDFHEARRNALTVLTVIKKAAPAASSTPAPPVINHKPSRVNDALKPEKLSASCSLGEFNAWVQDFDAYYSSNNMDAFPLNEQHAYIRNSLELKLQQLLKTKIDPTSTKEDCMDHLRQVFLRNNPLFIRRFNFFNCSQHKNEKFSDFNTRLELEGQDAELDQMDVDDFYALRFAIGTSDGELQKEFFQHKDPTRDNLYEVAMAFESAENAKDSLKGKANKVNSPKNKNQSKNQKQGKGRGNGQSHHQQGQGQHQHQHQQQGQQDRGRSQSRRYVDLRSKCWGCGVDRGAHDRANCPAANHICKTCNRKGHFPSVCTNGLIRGKSQTRGSANNVQNPSSSSSPAQTNTIYVNACGGNRLPQAKLQISPLPREPGSVFTELSLPDSGASDTLGSEQVLTRHGYHIDSSQKKLIEAANGSKMVCSGLVKVKVKFMQQEEIVDVYATPDMSDSLLLGFSDMIKLGMLPPTWPYPEGTRVNTAKPSPVDLSDIFQHFNDVFDHSDVIKPMEGPPVHIHLKSDIVPKKTYTARNIPLAYRQPAEEELQRLQKSGIIAPVTMPTEWCSPAIFIRKPNGSIRLVSDFRALNKFVSRPVHPFPTPSDIAGSIPSDAKFFVTLDAVKGYFQLPLHESSQDLTTFITPFGRFKYLRVPMGLSSAGDEFCRRGDEAFQGLPGIKKIVDDVLIYAPDMNTLKERVKTALQRCRQHGITLSKAKMQVGSNVKFAGFIISDQGISPDPDKLKAISEFTTPENITDLRSFCGLANQLGQFIPDLAHLLSPLRGLLKKSHAFQWTAEQQRAFEATKAALSDPSNPILSHFDASLPIELHTDASRLKGLGYALFQKAKDGSLRLITCGSRFLADAETRYAVCELEATAIHWAIQKCNIYLAGHEFEVLTDHRPLLSIFNGQDLDAINNTRLQRILEKLAGYSFNLRWCPGSKHTVADAFSRAPVDRDTCTVFALSLVTPEHITIEEISTAAQQDSEYQAIIQALNQNLQPKNLPLQHPARLFANVWESLATSADLGLLLYGSRIVIPHQLRKRTLELLHVSHQGISKTRELARQLYYWPGISNAIKQLIQQCEACSALHPSQAHEPQIHTSASRPMESVSLDLFANAGQTYLVMVDRFSGWPWVAHLRKTDTSAVLRTIQQWFQFSGFPDRIRTDGGPQFRSDFDSFCTSHDIVHELSSAHHHESNGHAEAAVKNMKYLLQKEKTWDSFNRALLEWRNTPRASNATSPAQAFLGRRQRTMLPVLPSSLGFSAPSSNIMHPPQPDSSRELPMLQVGTAVLMQDPHSGRWDGQGVIDSIRENGRSYVVISNGRSYIRNRRFLKKNLRVRFQECADSDE